MTTLHEARQKWQGMIRGSGGKCPCCDRWGKIYKRGINSTMACSLVWLAHHTLDTKDWVDVPKTAPRWVVQSNQLPTLRWWKLVDRPLVDPEDDKKHSGLWRATDSGIKWATNQLTIERFVWTYDGVPVAFEPPMVTINDVLGTTFSYDDVMKSRYDDL